MRTQYWKRKDIEALQDERLRELLISAARIPFWKNVFKNAGVDVSTTISSRKILEKIPVISKKELVQHSRLEDIANVTLLKKSNVDHTSGSTGRPFRFYHDWHASLRSFAVTERTFRTTGKRYPIVYMRSRPRYGFTFYKHVWFFLQSYNNVQYRMEDFKRVAQRLRRGFILYGYTSWVVEFARQMEKNRLSFPIRTVMVAGEHLSDTDRAYIQRVMQTELFTLYASREVGFLGFECERHAMHLNEEWALVEVVDENGSSLPKGHEGRIVVTVFDNRVMPFIRYELGDRGIVSEVPCACGRTLQTILFKGRTAELITLEDNRTVSVLDISYSIGSHGDAVRQYQIIQTGTLSFVFKIVPGVEFEMYKESLHFLMVRLLHPRAQVHWELVDSIPEAKSGKVVYFIRDFNYRPC